MRKKIISLVLFAVLVPLALMVAMLSASSADAKKGKSQKQSKVWVCHSTNSASNPWVLIHVSQSAADSHLREHQNRGPDGDNDDHILQNPPPGLKAGPDRTGLCEPKDECPPDDKNGGQTPDNGQKPDNGQNGGECPPKEECPPDNGQNGGQTPDNGQNGECPKDDGQNGGHTPDNGQKK